ncbi:carboxypeptidase-like regulatory domain-containing protein, partial [Patescibacteria group bacterium]|nr:carboxypeptidase-like regulatory domain-containing protein [Patescibacteria group bacterium]
FISLVAIVGFLPKENQAADRSPDVIGLRIIPNPDHLSALRWYQNQKFVGSPQSLLVDGYEAVRDGRTVYINVANIDSSDNLYTNINVISYNQEAESATLDIFGQIIKHWKFNTNITDELVKPKIIKDTARLAYLADIRKALGDYKKKNGYYPKLSAGSYLTNKTISTWPSWQGTLGKELGIILPIDPVNKIGLCTAAPSTDYDENTCWNNKDRKFSTSLPELPQQSQVFYYSASSTGARYNLCAVMTSGYISASDAIACDGSNFINHAPTITFPDLECPKRAKVNKDYNCHVKTADVDDNIVTFVSLLSQPADFSLNLVGVISGRPTSKGQYILKVAVKDNLGVPNEASYSLDVYTYCGDGKKQSPNGEMPSANEQCDGTDGTPANATCKADCTAWGCNSNYHQDGQNIACVSNTSLGCTLITPDVNAVDTVKSWTGSAWSRCKIKSCKDENLNTGYHLNVNTNKCDPNWQDCTVTAGTSNASSLEQYWIKSSSTWGGCIIKSCNAGYHLDAIDNSCVRNTKDCTNIIVNASSAVQNWDGIVNDWGSCEVVSCNSGYVNSSNSCRKNNAPKLSYSAASSEGIIPNVGTPDQTFVFEVIYKDIDNDAPSSGNPVVKILKNSTPTEYPMTAIGTETYAAGKLYRAEFKLNPGLYYHSFTAKDSYGLIATGVPCSFKRGPNVSNEPVLSDGQHLPASGQVNDTRFTFKVTYKDSQYVPYHRYPKVHILREGNEIPNSPFSMSTVASTSVNIGRQYQKILTLPYASSAYTYYFEAKNHVGVLAASIDKYIGPTVEGIRYSDLTGTVKDFMSGSLIKGAKITVEDNNNVAVASATTDNFGTYIIASTSEKILRDKQYKVIVEKAGFVMEDRDRELFWVNYQKVTKNFILPGDGTASYGVAKIVLSKRILTENIRYTPYLYAGSFGLAGITSITSANEATTTIGYLVLGRNIRYSVFYSWGGTGRVKIEIFNSGNVKVKEYLVYTILYPSSAIFYLSGIGKLYNIADSSPY